MSKVIYKQQASCSNGSRNKTRNKKILQKLKKKFQVKKAILFGSRARGDHMKHSDYDLIIVSPDFTHENMAERMSKMYDFWDQAEDLEPLCYTPEEYHRLRKTLPLLKRAEQEGIPVSA